MTMRTTTPVASRRTLVGLGGGVLAAALSASATGATPPGLPPVAVPGEALAETRYRTTGSGEVRSSPNERVNAIALASAEDFRRGSDLFGEGVRNTEAQRQNQAAFKRGFQTREAEMALGRLLGELADG